MVLLLSLSCRPRSAFFWLLSMLAVTTVGAIRPVRDFLPFMLPFGVLVQELFRWVYFKGCAGLCHLLKRGTPSIEFSIVSRAPSWARVHSHQHTAFSAAHGCMLTHGCCVAGCP